MRAFKSAMVRAYGEERPHQTRRRLAAVLSVVSACATTGHPGRSNEGVSYERAREIAAEFVRVNGLTAAPPDESSPLYRRQGPGFMVPREPGLDPRPCGVLRIARNRAGYTVAFRPLAGPLIDTTEAGQEHEIGSAVSMNIDGTDVKVDHLSVFLDQIEGCHRRS